MDMRFSRVTIDPDVMGGMPCIRSLRVPVSTVVAMVADQMTPAEILTELPDLEDEEHCRGTALRGRGSAGARVAAASDRMRLLLDQNLSPALTPFLIEGRS